MDNVVDTSIDNLDLNLEDMMEWEGEKVDPESYYNHLDNIINSNSFGINADNNPRSYNAIADNISGIFGMPYQFSENVDPVIESDEGKSVIGRKFSEKIFSVMPILFLTPGEPKFMSGFDSKAKTNVAKKLITALGGGDSGDSIDEEGLDGGRYYSFTSNFTEYKKYANVALRSLAMFMGIGDVRIPVPGKENRRKEVKLSNIDVEDFMNNNFTKLFGTQATVPFFLDASDSISESFYNNTSESMISQTVNGYSQTAKEIQFIMGSKDFGGLLGSIDDAIGFVSKNFTSAMGEFSSLLSGRNMISRISNELNTIVSGGKIVFPEIWSSSEYDKSYDINIKLRSPDPDPVSVFLNIYMPIILLVSMTAPRQIGRSSNSYQSPFLVRATYKSVFSCDLGIITSLSISKGGGPSKWNIMGHPTAVDVSVNLKDLYSSMFISKRAGLISNTAQMDYLATMAGIDLNEFEPTRMIRLAGSIIADTPRDWIDTAFGRIKETLNSKAAGALSRLRMDTRSFR